MPPTIRRSSERERQAIYNEHYAAKYLAGDYRVIVDKDRHPAPNRQWCTSSQLVVVYDRATNEVIIRGHRNERFGQILTPNGLDPKWILHNDVIYTE
jgi:hypothetical protein